MVACSPISLLQTSRNKNREKKDEEEEGKTYDRFLDTHRYDYYYWVFCICISFFTYE